MLLNVPVLVISWLPGRMLGVLILVVRAGVMAKDMLIWVLVLTMTFWHLRLRCWLLVSLVVLLHMVIKIGQRRLMVSFRAVQAMVVILVSNRVVRGLVTHELVVLVRF